MTHIYRNESGIWRVVHRHADPIAALREMWRVLKPGGRVGITVWAKGYARDLEPVLGECLSELGARPPSYPIFGTRPEDLPDALSQAGFHQITCEHRSIQLTYSGGVDEVIESCGASPLRAELMALNPSRAQQFRAWRSAFNSSLHNEVLHGVGCAPRDGIRAVVTCHFQAGLMF